ncbi:S-adenosyl-L-methionine-dependent methyltransferase [Phascolomyces articulosus]|uniref:S-adenosyl-L-methionine-dependent methyltransferase n=1 Tax=Phascolomyces articulosus TaxID=60185 RepID=A0AAD5PIK2_9FUNG|nr:S-adenosyl-L-methionine-dependent methyltransferase [Phascolomyces articulosus]
MNFDAPIEKELERGIRVLDSACGPGPWTLEMCNQYPNSVFYAVDVVSTYETMVNNAKYNNCKFICADVLKTLPFPDNHFDYIHQQLIVFGVQAHSWPNLLRELLRVLKPGGWIELNEAPPNDIVNIGPKFSVLNKCTIAKGFRTSISRELEGYLVNCGAINIETRPVVIPLQHGGNFGETWYVVELVMELLPKNMNMVHHYRYSSNN